MRAVRAQSRVCDRAREYSSRALDGELSDFERALLGSHLERCEACRAYSAELGQIVERLRLTPLEPLSHPISLPSRRRGRVRVLQIAAASAVAAVAATAGLVGALESRQSGAARPTTNFAAIVHFEDFHSQDVQELHKIQAALRISKSDFVRLHGRGQKPS
jgi:anti-sigma factor RsiW